MKVYLIKKGTMGGSEFLQMAFLNEGACKLACKEKDGEWMSHELTESEGEEISNNRVIVDGKVYNIDRTGYISALAGQAMKKLEPEEIDALKQLFSSK